MAGVLRQGIYVYGGTHRVHILYTYVDDNAEVMGEGETYEDIDWRLGKLIQHIHTARLSTHVRN